MRILIAGAGEERRGDDAAGLLAVRQLRAWQIPAVEVHDLFELPSLMEDADAAWIADAVCCPEPAGSVVLIDGLQNIPAELRLTVTTHGFGVAEAIQLARSLNILPAEVLIFGISAGNFDLGSEPSPQVVRGALEAASQIRDRWTRARRERPGSGRLAFP